MAYKKKCPNCGSEHLRISATITFFGMGFDLDEETGEIDYNIADSEGSEENDVSFHCEDCNKEFSNIFEMEVKNE